MLFYFEKSTELQNTVWYKNHIPYLGNLNKLPIIHEIPNLQKTIKQNHEQRKS